MREKRAGTGAQVEVATRGSADQDQLGQVGTGVRMRVHTESA
jgi:hypothetical protein